MAKEIAARLFVESIQPNPLPNHPDGSIVCLSVNYSRVEEDKVTSYHFEEHDIETRQLGMAIVVGGIPDDYFHGIGRNKALDYSLNEPFELQAERAYAKRLSTLLTSKK
jgi:hypothetical protein